MTNTFSSTSDTAEQAHQPTLAKHHKGKSSETPNQQGRVTPSSNTNHTNRQRARIQDTDQATSAMHEKIIYTHFHYRAPVVDNTQQRSTCVSTVPCSCCFAQLWTMESDAARVTRRSGCESVDRRRPSHVKWIVSAPAQEASVSFEAQTPPAPRRSKHLLEHTHHFIKHGEAADTSPEGIS